MALFEKIFENDANDIKKLLEEYNRLKEIVKKKEEMIERYKYLLSIITAHEELKKAFAEDKVDE